MKQKIKKVRNYFRSLGPGLITGAADEDPSGIATCTQTGAQFGYGQLWTALLILPLLIAIQEACARIGAVTGKGIAGVIKQHFSKKILFAAVFLNLIANTINIGADISAMAATAQLLVPINYFVLAIFFTAVIVLLITFMKYRTYANFLKYLCLALLAYPITVLIVQEDWMQILKATFIPHIEFNSKFLYIIVGIFGTSISPYMFFWQSSQEVEEVKAKGFHRDNADSSLPVNYLSNVRLDNLSGMVFSQITTWSIIVVGAAVLHKHGITNVTTAADAAKALEPLVHTFPNAGLWAKLIFSIGVLGLGMLAIPVLAGSAAYALGEALDLTVGLNHNPRRAPAFYGIILGSMLIGLLMNLVGIDPIKALVFSAVINGVVAVPLIFLIAMIGKNEKIMKKYKSSVLSQTFVWITFVVMALAVVAMFLSYAFNK